MSEIFEFKIKTENAAENLSEVEAKLKKINKERAEYIKKMSEGKQLTQKEVAALSDLTKKSKSLSAEKRKLNKEVELSNKLTKDNNDAYDKLNASLAKARMEYRNLAAQNKQNTARGRELLEQITEQDAKLKEIDAAMGQHQRNVGNYKDDIISAFEKMGVPVSGFNRLLAMQATAQSVLQKANIKTAGTLKILKMALISTGIGAIVVAVGMLAKAFLSTQQGVDTLNKYLMPLQAVMQRLWGLVQDLSIGIVNAFKNPKQAIRDLWELIKSQIVNRLKGVKNMFMALGRVISSSLRGKFSEAGEAAKEMGEAFLQVMTGVEDVTDKVRKGFNELKEEVKEATEVGKRLAELKEAQEILAIEIARNEGGLNRKYQEQYAILRDVNKSMEERLTAGRAAVAASEKLRDLKMQELELQIEEAQLRASLNNNDRKAQLELARMEAQRDQLQADHLKQQKNLQEEIQGLVKETTNLMFKVPEEAEEFDAEIEYLSKIFMESIEGRRALLQTQLNQGVIGMTEYAHKMKQIDDEILANKKANTAATIQLTANAVGALGDLLGTQKTLLSAEALMNTYLSASMALTDKTIPNTFARIAAMVTVITTGLRNVAQINDVKFADGGIIGGKPHSQGGTQFYGSDGSRFEAERGELLAIVNRRDTEMLTALSAANSRHGKSFFADGGLFVPQGQMNNDISNVAEIVRAMGAQKVYVLENEISEKQRHVRTIENRGDI